MYLFHNATENLTPVILTKNAEPQLVAIIVDSEGRGHRIPPNRPWKVEPQISMDTDKGGAPMQALIPAEKVAAQLIKDGAFFGLVAVPEIQTANGISFDVETAAKESTRIRYQAESAVLETYVKHAKDEQLANRAMRPPSPSIERILNSRSMDLKRDFGLEPVGYKVSEKAAQRDREVEALKEQNALLTKELGELKDMFAMFMEDKKESRKKETVKA